jgi:hypothetical protein
MHIVLSHPTGNANVRAVLSGLFDSGLLNKFFTTWASFPGSPLDSIGAFSPFTEIRRRRFDPSIRNLTNTFPYFELGRVVATKFKLDSLISDEKDVFSIDSVYNSLDRHVANSLSNLTKQGVNAVYAFDDGALHSFNQAKMLGLKCIFDLPTGHWRALRRLLATEQERWPEWAATLPGLRDSDAKLARKDKELELADLILVASNFTAKTLEEYPGKLAPVKIIPYGFPPANVNRSYKKLRKGDKIKLLFVGKLSQQKGIAELFAAVEPFNQYLELTIVGRKVSNDCPALDAALAKHQWIPSLPHQAILDLMKEHDVVIFPSLFDGFGLVISEAMAQGTPVIATERCAGPDFIINNENGWLVDAGSVTSLQCAIENLLLDPESISQVGEAAMKTAIQRPWAVYQRELVTTITNHLHS